jgi:hypothetical protein
LLPGPARLFLRLRLQAGQTLFRTADARLELVLLQEPLLVTIDQSGNAAPHLLDHTRQLLGFPVLSRPIAVQPPLELRFDPLGVPQNGTDIVPHGLLQPTRVQLPVAAGPLPTLLGVGFRPNA